MAVPTELGPVEYIVVKFENGKFEGNALKELVSLQERGIIRVLDLMFISRDADGQVAWLDYDGLVPEGELVAGIFPEEMVGLLSERDVDELALGLEPGEALGVLVFEDTWATDLQAAMRGAGGRLVEASRVPKDAVDAALAYVEQQMEEVG